MVSMVPQTEWLEISVIKYSAHISLTGPHIPLEHPLQSRLGDSGSRWLSDWAMMRDSITPVRLRKGIAEIQLGMFSYLFLFSVHAHLRVCECACCVEQWGARGTVFVNGLQTRKSFSLSKGTVVNVIRISFILKYNPTHPFSPRAES